MIGQARRSQPGSDNDPASLIKARPRPDALYQLQRRRRLMLAAAASCVPLWPRAILRAEWKRKWHRLPDELPPAPLLPLLAGNYSALDDEKVAFFLLCARSRRPISGFLAARALCAGARANFSSSRDRKAVGGGGFPLAALALAVGLALGLAEALEVSTARRVRLIKSRPQ